MGVLRRALIDTIATEIKKGDDPEKTADRIIDAINEAGFEVNPSSWRWLAMGLDAPPRPDKLQ